MGGSTKCTLWFLPNVPQEIFVSGFQIGWRYQNTARAMFSFLRQQLTGNETRPGRKLCMSHHPVAVFPSRTLYICRKSSLIFGVRMVVPALDSINEPPPSSTKMNRHGCTLVTVYKQELYHQQSLFIVLLFSLTSLYSLHHQLYTSRYFFCFL